MFLCHSSRTSCLSAALWFLRKGQFSLKLKIHIIPLEAHLCSLYVENKIHNKNKHGGSGTGSCVQKSCRRRILFTNISNERNWWRTSCPVLLDVHHCSSCPVGISLELLAPPTLMISGGTDLLSRIHKLSENVQRDGWSGCKERYASRRRSLVLQGYLSACLLSKTIEPQQ